MDLSKLRAQLTKHEGLALKVYNDSMGIPSIGIGRNLRDKGITAMEAMFLLDGDITETIDWLNKNCPWWKDLDEVRARAIVDLAFNLRGKLLGFKNMISAIIAKDWGKAHDELLASTFATQTGNRARDLANQILTGKD
jgi:lysozyme